MADISIVWDSQNSRGDWQVQSGDLLTGQDLTTACLISLFSDRVAQAGDIITDGTNDPRGWWGDVQPDGTTDAIGSRLWLLSREKQTTDTLNRAVTYAKESLQWLIDDGVAAQVKVSAQWNAASFLALLVTVIDSNGNVLVSNNFNWAWRQI
jgi:phage gp46-like protein